MRQSQKHKHREKIDGLLRAALAAPDGPARTKLISKASYWNGVALKAARPPPQGMFDGEARTIGRGAAADDAGGAQDFRQNWKTKFAPGLKPTA
jgi:hypothetical protein